MPEARPQRFAQLRRAEGVAADDRFLHGTGDLVIPAHTRVTLLLDQGELTLGHPVLRTSGGSGARAILTYAESLFDAQGRTHVSAQAREVFDVTGAGDTVIATLACAVGAGMSLPDSVTLANKAGGVVVGKLGTAVILPEELN